MQFFTQTLHIPAPLAVLAFLTEFLGGAFLIVGLFTRWAALLLAGEMVVAALLVHLKSGFFMNWTNAPNVGHGIEYNLALVGASLALVLAGGGRFSLDAEGKIHGSGHPTRDALGWTIPLLWPVKLITLPMRGPRPTLRGELPVTLRLLEDVSVPRDAYLISQNPKNHVGDGSDQPQGQTRAWSESLQGRTGKELYSNSPPISAPRGIQDRYRMPYRIEDRFPRSVEVWRGWVPKRKSESNTGQNDVK